MPSFLADNAHYLLLAIIGVWFAARFLVMPGGGRRRGGLAALFRREGAVIAKGLASRRFAPCWMIAVILRAASPICEALCWQDHSPPAPPARNRPSP